MALHSTDIGGGYGRRGRTIFILKTSTGRVCVPVGVIVCMLLYGWVCAGVAVDQKSQRTNSTLYYDRTTACQMQPEREKQREGFICVKQDVDTASIANNIQSTHSPIQRPHTPSPHPRTHTYTHQNTHRRAIAQPASLYLPTRPLTHTRILQVQRPCSSKYPPPPSLLLFT